MKEQSLNFLTRFLLTAALGSAAITFIAPFVRPAVLPDGLQAASQSIRAHPALAQIADHLAAALLWSRSSRPPSPPPARTPTVTAPPAVPATPAAHTAPTETAAPTEDAAPPPPTAARWAVITSTDAPVYLPTGQFSQRLAAGTVVNVLELRELSTGPAALCRLPPPNPPGSGNFLVRRDQIDLHEGALDTLTTETLEIHQQHARLLAELEQIKITANGSNRTDNPQWPAFDRATQAFNRGAEHARNLQRKFDEATGDARMKLADELRRLKSEELRLTKTLAAARREYDTWNAAHPSPELRNNPRVQELEAEIASLAAELAPPDPTL